MSSLCLTVAAEAIGAWKLYPSYAGITDIQPAGKKVYVLASNNLYSYNVGTTEVETYTMVDILNAQNITHIAWVPTTKKLLIVYKNYLIDILDEKGNVSSITGLQSASSQKDKTVHNILVGDDKYVFLETGLGMVKIDTREEYIQGVYTDINAIQDLPKEKENDAANEYGPLVYDATNKCYWGSNADGELAQYRKDESGNYQPTGIAVMPDGPKRNSHYRLLLDNSKLYSLSSIYENLNYTNAAGGVQCYDISSDKWNSFDTSFAEQHQKVYLDDICMAIDPRDHEHLMVGGRTGLFEYRKEKLVNFYDCNSGTPIIDINKYGPDYTIITGMCYDSMGNLWIFNMGNENIVCLTKDGQWKTFKHEGLSDGKMHISFLRCDSNNRLWFANNQWQVHVVGVYNTQNDKLYMLKEWRNQNNTKPGGENNAISQTIAIDKEENLWVGNTTSTFYIDPDNRTLMLNNRMDDVRVTQYAVPRNDGTGLADYLLDGVNVRDIKFDAAGRKWVASESGVFLISADNNTQSHHFTMENSPLPSDVVYSIEIDNESGRVYFATENGLCSYMSDVTEHNGSDQSMSDDNVWAYPNPVEPGYTGPITIVGLKVNSSITITNTSGKVVHKGRCIGGSYEWDGCDASGKLVASGVYMVLTATEEAEEGCVTKIAVIR